MDYLVHIVPHAIWAAALVWVARLYLGKRSDLGKFNGLEAQTRECERKIELLKLAYEPLPKAVERVGAEVLKLQQIPARKQVF